MLIGELSKKTGFSRDTIRYYEKRGLIKLSWKQRRDNDYKEYPDATVDRLLITRQLKDHGFSLTEIREILELYDEEELECDDLEAWVAQKADQIKAKIESLQAIHQKITTLQQQAEHCADNKCQLELRGN